MKACVEYTKRIIAHFPIFLVLLELHFDGIEGLDKAESQKHLSRGNQLLNAGQLAEALTHYHTAIDQDERNYQAYYMRATVFLAMGKARSALPDLNQVVKLQPNFVQARLQRGNLFLKMGKFNEAQTDYEAVLAQEDNAEATMKVEEIRPLRRNVNHAQTLMESNDFHGVIQLLNVVIESCPWNSDFREARALAYEHVGDLRRAISDLKPTTVLKLDNTVAYLKMSSLWYRLGEIEQSLEEIRECLKLDPDHKECYAHYKSVKKLFKTIEAAKSRMSESNWEEAINKYKKVLTQESRVAPLTIEIKLKICECYVKWNKKYPEALNACINLVRTIPANDPRAAGGYVLLSHLHTQLGKFKSVLFVQANNPKEGIIAADDVLTLDPSNIPALLLRSEAQTQNEDYEQALDDLQKAAKIDENYPGLSEKIKKAQKQLKQSQKRDYYKILGVPRNADKKQVIKSYRKLAREWHPDNFQNEEEKKAAEKKFIEIAAAKEVLSDPEKVRILKDGFDPMDSDDVTEWEKEQALGRTNNLFEFFFHHNAKGETEKPREQNPFEELFRSFTQRKSERFHDEETFEKQFKNDKKQQFKHAHEELWKQQQREKLLREQQEQEQEALRKQHELRQKQREYRQKQEEILRKHQELLRQKQEQRAEKYSKSGRQETDAHQRQQHQHNDFRQGHSQPHQQNTGYKKQTQHQYSQYHQQTAQQPRRDTRDPTFHHGSDQSQQHSTEYRNQEYSQHRQERSDPRYRHRQQEHGQRSQQQFYSESQQTHYSKQQRQQATHQQSPFTDQQKRQPFPQQQNPDQQNFGQRHRQQEDRSNQQQHYSGEHHHHAQFERQPHSQFRNQQHFSQHSPQESDRHNRKTSQSDFHEEETKKKTKSKHHFKKKTEEETAAKHYVKGQDGKWYRRGSDGRWKAHDGPPPPVTHSKKKQPKAKKPPTQSAQDQEAKSSGDTYQDEKGNVYVRGTDGNWYMRVQPPNVNKRTSTDSQPPHENKEGRRQYASQGYEQRTQKADQHSDHIKKQSHYNQQRSEPARDLPRGLFRNERGQITDRIGNVYEKLLNGRFKLAIPAAEAKERLKEQLRSHKQADLLRQQREKEAAQASSAKQNIYHDADGNVFVKDVNGNLIRIKPGAQGGPSQQQPPPKTQSDADNRFSYRDPDVAQQQKRWHAPDQNRESKNFNQQTAQNYRQEQSSYGHRQAYQQHQQQHHQHHSEQGHERRQPFSRQQGYQTDGGYHRQAQRVPAHEEL